MIRRRGETSPRDDSSSEEEEDVFAALSRKNTKRVKRSEDNNNQQGPLLEAPPSRDSPTQPLAGHAQHPHPHNQHRHEQQQNQSSPQKSREADAAIKSGTAGGIATAATTGITGNHSNNSQQQPQHQQLLPMVSLTSSMKRHHKPSDKRKAKMDALLQELKAEKNRTNLDPHRFIPEKKGSFVEQSEEHLTTNIFVGNLAPSITEEALTDLFIQFGDLYSVKIMWPRTPAERSRNRNTGFVCFMTREDAEEAMEACSETDPFNVGRLLMMRWGKNVKKLVKRGTGGGIALTPILKRPRSSLLYGASPVTNVGNGTSQFHDGDNDDPQSIPIDDGYEEDADDDSTGLSGSRKDRPPKIIEMRTGSANIAMPVKYQPQLHSKDAIRVEAPPNRERFNFVTMVAFFVSKDGSHLEKRLLQREARNPKFAFLQSVKNAPPQQRLEHIFYRWRVFAFCQGDGFSVWRTEPFVMFHPHGRFWIPPTLDKEAARQEEMDERAHQEALREQKKQRRRLMGKREYLTGRQIERARDGRRGGKAFDGGSELSTEELEQFDLLVKKKLTTSRRRICQAMAFCFEKSGAAKEISELVKEALTDPSASLDMRIARLYLLSDILFNSQQPGVRNAFLYRDAIEKMAPLIFTSLGKHGGGNVGRMTMNKLRTAVSAVLGAWTDWSVYNPTFMDELEARFEGREIKDPNAEVMEAPKEEGKEQQEPHQQEEDKVTIDQPRGDWTEVKEEEEVPRQRKSKSTSPGRDEDMDVDGEEYLNPDGDSLGEADVDGEELDVEELDGSPVSDSQLVDQSNNLEEGVDGVALDSGLEEEADGEKLTSDDDCDGEPIHVPDVETMNALSSTSLTNHRIPLDSKEADDGSKTGDSDVADGEDLDGDLIERDDCEDDDGKGMDRKALGNVEAIDGEELDGRPIDGDELDGEVVDGDDFDGEMIDGDELDGEPLDAKELDGEPFDGEQLDVDQIDGESLGGESLDGEPIDGVSLDGEAVDGESLGDEALDGESLDGEPIDGDDFDGESIDGEALDDVDGDPLYSISPYIWWLGS